MLWMRWAVQPQYLSQGGQVTDFLWWWMAAGTFAVLGHVFPVYLGFRGGKGVATYIGVLLGLYWPGAIAFCVTWLVVAAIADRKSVV